MMSKNIERYESSGLLPTNDVEQELIPRCDEMDGSTLRIVPAYTEAGMFCEANCLTVTDGERTCVYVPFAVARSGGPS